MDLRWILLFVSVILIALIAWHGSKNSLINAIKHRFTRKAAPKQDNFLDYYHEEVQEDLFDVAEPRVVQNAAPAPAVNQIFCLNLKAPEGKHFTGEQLVIHFNRAGLRFGQFDIFHYEDVFSLASAFEPGTFDLNRLDNFKTSALTFFMETAHLDDVREGFETMLDTAQHLAEQLRADLFDEKWQPLTENALDQYYDKIDQHCEHSEAIQDTRLQ